MLALSVHDEEEVVVLRFEHSLLSLSKWESKHCKPFLASASKTAHEMIDYFQAMLVSPEDRPELVLSCSAEQLEELTHYINTPQTASKVPPEGTQKYNPEVTTSELMYYWLVAMKIPFHPTETWHLSRLQMLVQITNFKNQPPKKRKMHEVMTDWRSINERQSKLFEPAEEA